MNMRPGGEPPEAAASQEIIQSSKYREARSRTKRKAPERWTGSRTASPRLHRSPIISTHPEKTGAQQTNALVGWSITLVRVWG